MANYGHLETSPSHYHRYVQRSDRKRYCCGFSTTFIVYILYVFNFILIISGLIILAVTLFYGWSSFLFGENLELPALRRLLPKRHSLNLMYYAMVVCSALIFIVAILNLIYNCVNARKSSKVPRREECQEIDEMTLTFTNCALNNYHREKQLQKPKPYSSLALCIFIFALLFLFTFQLSISFVSLVTSFGGNGVQNSETEFVRLIRENLNESATNNEILAENRDVFDSIQTTYKCCGLESYEDYGSNQVPDTCCKTISFNCSWRKHPSNIYHDGCVNKTMTACNRHIIVLGSVAFGLSFIYVFGLVFSVCLFVQIMRLRN